MSGEELRARRKALDMTQEELADALGTTTTTVARWERGEADPPTFLALALDQVEAISLTPAMVRTPHGPFEVNLFARYLREHLERWASFGAPLRAAPGPYQGDGTWLLYVEPIREQTPEQFWHEFFGPQIVGRCWLEADDWQEPVPCWSVPKTEYCEAQRNRVDDTSPLTVWHP